MKCLLLFFAVLLVFNLSSSCTNSTNANAQKASSAITASSSTGGDAVFSYNLDGTKVSGGEVDATQTNNIAMITKNDKGNKASFFLGDAYQQNRETFAHSLRFAIPAKTGTVTLTPDEDYSNVQLFLGNSQDDKYVLYANEAFSITVTTISATRLSGTFSGKLKLVDGTGAGKAELVVTDGKFDIPLRSDKQ